MDGQVMLAAVLAVASACGFAVSTSLQHRVAGQSAGTGALRVLRYVLTRPVWLLGALVGLGALVLHALALNKGAIALVQPIMISGVVLAVIFRAGLERRLPPRAELAAVGLTAAALVGFLLVVEVSGHRRADDWRALVFWLAGVSLIGLVVLASYRLTDAHAASLTLGVASGVCFGLTAGLLKLLSIDFGADGLLGLVTTWHLPALVATGLFGIAVNQRAYRLAPLAISMPVLNVVDVLVAVAFGMAVFGEVPAEGPVGITLLGAFLLLMGVGLRLIARVHERAATPLTETVPVGRS